MHVLNVEELTVKELFRELLSCLIRKISELDLCKFVFFGVIPMTGGFEYVKIHVIKFTINTLRAIKVVYNEEIIEIIK